MIVPFKVKKTVKYQLYHKVYIHSLTREVTIYTDCSAILITYSPHSSALLCLLERKNGVQ